VFGADEISEGPFERWDALTERARYLTCSDCRGHGLHLFFADEGFEDRNHQAAPPATTSTLSSSSPPRLFFVFLFLELLI
jgi:hypothetical protein